ncbi:hypothetical protein ABB37_02178 [Leptomonas pyrrhocoris]|uniref:Uncharacterized protein n=1 Tax=Leptomonas pyrrhocoris TaxID=157538 RepID=A0A0N0DYE8_LEPPY|nr:hypothetical protein ABB37_02178 [Leptomonas pyrrhocoris]XP_015662495.1 hypothetical protein ABB37_02178 [Leptomonas pyrrhocoris]XP_015662496.1 hypothetical protein ABB37_02178 [Leptomonas pyrrhocoris]XP_015662497.1 hypothetical protein ABB37_02178 [Leptomonas pyrrhocoris]KPA84055.1 hypothetical protein ABB37_02178 [Leptomonas pyrrhocoris]KPA84056.1 hypothetical protein ABB37_02178 [Leptomonas pyrrhocoris]KPA84057.1 hypothetical protein ABB37_02178 [Leptomonas pyrrhocoris]KPA84058.1 hypot|eukprot:XP_015662494.1 hypothetical protein ABB37_02178 [Leptomonas pyrrhocoris]
MNKPHFTTDPYRITRLQENYDEGVKREKMPTIDREKRDLHCLHVTDEKLLFLYQNAMESYSSTVKNQKIKEYNEVYISTAPVASKDSGKSRFRFL